MFLQSGDDARRCLSLGGLQRPPVEPSVALSDVLSPSV